MARDWRTLVAGTITAGAVIVFVTTFAHAVWYAPEQESAQPQLAALAAAAHAGAVAGAPLRLRVPALGIDAAVQQVGVGKTGNMAVPSNFTDVGWYRYGPEPGQAGSAVIDGHVDNGLSLPGVFKKLNTIAKGDDIYIATASTTLHFAVSDIELYPYTEVPTGSIFAATGPPRLVLITCDGAWVAGQRTYDHRLVVYADLRP